MGVHLRKRYNDLLGDTYVPYEVIARSSDYDRTKMSLLLVLSALYPPNDKQQWHPTFNWQPIPTVYTPKDYDSLLQADHCPQ